MGGKKREAREREVVIKLKAVAYRTNACVSSTVSIKKQNYGYLRLFRTIPGSGIEGFDHRRIHS